ncbi:MAG: nitroreductase family protein [Oscillospiraceae bacterium]|nr:nitroreductase family protein [Oscillospiraceae bacterium]
MDAALLQRQTTRAFSDKKPEREKMDAIIEAGRLAPFAGLVQRDCDRFRHFFVLSRDSEMMPKLQVLVQQGRKAEAERMVREGLDKRFPESAATLSALGERPATDLLLAPYLIVVAERGGVPQREKVVLGYVLENMWLKAAELGLGLKVCSGVADIADTAAHKTLFALDENETYAFDAVSVGYPKETPPVRTAERKPLASLTDFE